MTASAMRYNSHWSFNLRSSLKKRSERRVAQSLSLSISGIAGQIIRAFRQQIIAAAEARTKLSELLQAGRINRKIYEALIAAISHA